MVKVLGFPFVEASASTPTKENVIASAASMSISSKELSLEGLNLTAVPSQVWESGEIRKIPLDGFQAVSGLQILDLSGNAASLGIGEHPKFSYLPLLQELYLSRVQLPEVPEDILNLSNLLILDYLSQHLRF
ncbi:Leucine-rich repeat (LRR) family protein [Raphanus sativus]|nr:Leucine-rich repeat (LRR) family protein [Raphanus sativus]